MGTYMQGYGVEEERRNRVIKRIILGAVAAAVLAFVSYLFLHNYTEKKTINQFLAEINAHDYKAAYANWCNSSSPCPNYDYARFLQDWGPQKKISSPWKVASVESCKSFVTINVQAEGAELQSLGVQRGTRNVMYAPAPECQELGWHWKAFFQRIFGGS